MILVLHADNSAMSLLADKAVFVILPSSSQRRI